MEDDPIVCAGAWGQANLPLDSLGGDQLSLLADDRPLRMQYILETTRKFAPVAGFVYHDRQLGKKVFLDLQAAQVSPPPATGDWTEIVSSAFASAPRDG